MLNGVNSIHPNEGLSEFVFLHAELKEEMRPDSLPDVSEVTKFDASKLKHVETKEANVLPTKEGSNNFLKGLMSNGTTLQFLEKWQKNKNPPSWSSLCVHCSFCEGQVWSFFFPQLLSQNCDVCPDPVSCLSRV